MNLIFKNFQLIGENSLENLPELRQKQLLISVKECFGVNFSLMNALSETYEGNCEFWQVFEEKVPDVPLYDVWIFDVDTAVVFHANTTKDTSVGMIQYSFDPLNEKTPQLRELADALQKAHRKRPKIDYLKESAKAYNDALRKMDDSEDD